MQKIIGGGLHLLGIGGKKKAAAAATPAADQKGPILTPLGPGVVPPNRRRMVPGQQPQGTILGGSDRLGG
jgi:hypothetical protein